MLKSVVNMLYTIVKEERFCARAHAKLGNWRSGVHNIPRTDVVQIKIGNDIDDPRQLHHDCLIK